MPRISAERPRQDEVRNISNASTGFHFAGGNGSGHERRRAVLGNCCRDDFKCLGGALHYVMPAGTMDMDVHKARHNGFSFGRNLARATRHGNFSSRAYRGDFGPLDHNDRVGDFFKRRKRTVGVDGNRQHRSGDYPT